jgi:hypothetical protein
MLIAAGAIVNAAQTKASKSTPLVSFLLPPQQQKMTQLA